MRRPGVVVLEKHLHLSLHAEGTEERLFTISASHVLFAQRVAAQDLTYPPLLDAVSS